MRSQLLHSTWFLISTQFLITTYLQQHLISWFPWFTWYSCSVLNTFSLVHATDMQSIVELVWSFFYPTHLNQIDPLWQPLICHLKHLWQKLILVWHLCILHQYYPQIVICTLLSDISVTTTGLANLFSSSLFDNLLGSNSPLTDMFYTKSTRLSTLYCYVTAYNKGISNRSTQQINCIVSKVYIS